MQDRLGSEYFPYEGSHNPAVEIRLLTRLDNCFEPAASRNRNVAAASTLKCWAWKVRFCLFAQHRPATNEPRLILPTNLSSLFRSLPTVSTVVHRTTPIAKIDWIYFVYEDEMPIGREEFEQCYRACAAS